MRSGEYKGGKHHSSVGCELLLLQQWLMHFVLLCRSMLLATTWDLIMSAHFHLDGLSSG